MGIAWLVLHSGDGTQPTNILSNVVMPGTVMVERTHENLDAERREQIRQQMAMRQLSMPEDVTALIVFLRSSINLQIAGEIIRITRWR